MPRLAADRAKPPKTMKSLYFQYSYCLEIN